MRQVVQIRRIELFNVVVRLWYSTEDKEVPNEYVEMTYDEAFKLGFDFAEIPLTLRLAEEL